MTSPDGRFTIAYNGEITNFVEVRRDLQRAGVPFRTAGDTEVLLEAWRAWGPACLDRLEGMYAFAMLDRGEGRLTLARDPFGIKPLFVAQDDASTSHGARVLFASEVPSLLALRDSRAHLDDQVALDYLAWGTYDRGERTFLSGITHLLPGTTLVVPLDGPTLRAHRTPRTWMPSIQTDTTWNPTTAADAARDLFLASISRNLRSDVPIGLALSGGIDSSAIASAVRAVDPELPIRTFSFVSPGSPADESRWIARVNEAVGAQPTLITAQPAELIDDLDDLVLSQGEPFGSLSIYAQYRVFRSMHEAGIVVSLDGQGADEMLAGYRGYPAARISSLVRSGRPLAGLAYAHRWSRLPGASRAAAIGHLASALGLEDAVGSLRARARREQTPLRTDVVATRGLRRQPPTLGNYAADAGRDARLKAALRVDLLGGGLAALLRHGDRNSMRFSVEGRVPFLDRPLVDFCLSLPEELLVDREGTTKAVFRRAMRGLVPDAVLDRRDKIGFEAPASWLAGERKRLADIVATGPSIAIVDGAAAATAIRSGTIAPATTWRLVNLSRWAALMSVDAD
jgi:asparagine synthase (glutamine-hydrolysing)